MIWLVSSSSSTMARRPFVVTHSPAGLSSYEIIFNFFKYFLLINLWILEQIRTIGIKHLNAFILRISNNHSTRVINGDALWSVKSAWLRSLWSDELGLGELGINNQNTMEIEISRVQLILPIETQSPWIVKMLQWCWWGTAKPILWNKRTRWCK